jgi:hypothetical protein
VIERSHQVGFTEAAFANHHHGPPVVRADGLNSLQQIMRGISDFEELAGCDLGCARLLIVSQLDGSAF